MAAQVNGNHWLQHNTSALDEADLLIYTPRLVRLQTQIHIHSQVCCLFVLIRFIYLRWRDVSLPFSLSLSNVYFLLSFASVLFFKQLLLLFPVLLKLHSRYTCCHLHTLRGKRVFISQKRLEILINPDWSVANL